MKREDQGAKKNAFSATLEIYLGQYILNILIIEYFCQNMENSFQASYSKM